MASTVDESAAVPGATTVAAKSLEADIGVADAVPKSIAEKPTVLEELMALLRHRGAWSDTLSGHRAPRWCLQLQLRRTRWKRLNVRNLDPRLSESSVDATMRWWSLRRRTPLGSSRG